MAQQTYRKPQTPQTPQPPQPQTVVHQSPLEKASPSTPEPTSEPEPMLREEAITLSFAEVDQLSSVLGRNIFTAQDLLDHCARLTTIQVGDVKIVLEPGLIERLHSRAGYNRFSDYVEATVRQLLFSHCGW